MQTVEPKLVRTSASGDLLPARLTPILGRWSSPRAKLRGQELRIANKLSLDEDACAGFVLDFAAQGGRIEATAHGASAPLLTWALHEIGVTVKAELVGDAVSADREAAMRYLDDYEAWVDGVRGTELDGDGLVKRLAQEELIVVGETASDHFAELPLDDAARTYEALLEDDAIEDIFVSERELSRLLSRFRAIS